MLVRVLHTAGSSPDHAAHCGKQVAVSVTSLWQRRRDDAGGSCQLTTGTALAATHGERRRGAPDRAQPDDPAGRAAGAADENQLEFRAPGGLCEEALWRTSFPISIFAPTIGVYARSGTPPAVIEKIAAEIAAIVKEPDVIKLFSAAEPSRSAEGPMSLGGR